MCALPNKLLYYALLGLIFFLLSSCDKVSLPRLTFDEKQEERIPVTVLYAFSPNLVNYTKSVDGCGLPYTIPVGQIIAQTFLEVGHQRFDGVRAEPPVGDGQTIPPDGYRIRLDLNQFIFDPVTRMGEEDRYDVFLDLKLHAIYEDATGTPLAQTPLNYHQKLRLWVPALGSQGNTCSTTQLDKSVKNAAETLAKDMVSVMPRLGQPTQSAASQLPPSKPSPTAAPAPAQPPNPAGTATSSQSAISPSVQFRTKLVDANRNLILEGGEAVILLIETTNVSESIIPSAYVELRGTPELVEAFKRVAPIPVPIGELKAGEKRTAEIRGRLGDVKEPLKGELIIGIVLSEGLPPGSHSIRAEIQPRSASKKSSR